MAKAAAILSLVLVISTGAAAAALPAFPSPQTHIIIDATSDAGPFTAMTDVSQGGIREVTSPQFWRSVAPVLKTIRAGSVRIDHIFDDSYYGIISRDQGGNLSFRWDRLRRRDWGDDCCWSSSLSDSQLHAQCHKQKKRSLFSPNGIPRLGAVCRELVGHLKSRFKLEGLYYEVWNEPDLDEFWQGSQQQYLELYKVSARAIKEVDGTAKVGGPAIAHLSLPWIAAFLNYVGDLHLPLDFVSWHAYNPSPEVYDEQIRSVKNIFTDFPDHGPVDSVHTVRSG